MIVSNLETYINQLFTSPYQLFILYLITNCIPSFALAYTEPINIFGKICMTIFSSGFNILLLSIPKNSATFILYFPLYIVFHCMQIVLLYIFGEAVIAVDMFLNLATTNATEAGELLDNIWPIIFIVCFIYAPTLLIAFFSRKSNLNTPNTFKKKAQRVAFILIAVSFVISFFGRNDVTRRFTYHEDVYPINVFYNLGFAINKYYQSKNYPSLSKDFKFHSIKSTNASTREIYVLVVGEASRAENWQLYGYHRNTNPKLYQNQGIVKFDDVLTQSITTHKSVPLILTSASAEDYSVIYSHKSIVNAFKEAGFKTAFYSNQIPDGSFLDYYAQEADSHENIRHSEAGGYITINNYDEFLLPLLQNFIDSTPGNLFIVLHTYGSHYNYRERYPTNFSVFTPDDSCSIKKENRQLLINSYDNTIAYTDDFLSNVISILESSKATTAMFYSSDHGEDMLDDDRQRFLHSSPSPTYYQLKIPMFMWFSNLYKSAFPSKVQNAANNHAIPITTNTVFHTVLDMASLNTTDFDPQLSLVNQNLQKQHRMFLNDHDKPIFFYNSGIKSQDKEMIEKRHINYM